MNNYDSYYPRPLLRRKSFFSLNGIWKLNGKEITVPFPVESSLSGYIKEENENVYIYEKDFVLEKSFIKGKVILNFGAVDQIADIFLNGKYILHHEGGYDSFKVDITEYIKDTNQLKVIVKDELDTYYPYGKQSYKRGGMWYTPVSGIWQSVFIESYPEYGIDNLTIRTDKNHLYLDIDSVSDKFTVSFENYKEEFNSRHIEITVEDPHLWSLEDPYLYDLTVKTRRDTVTSYFGLREIRTDCVNGHKAILLNDKPVFLNGLLDQGYYLKGIYTPENTTEYENDIKTVKELGYNFLRKHIKVEPEAFYYYCDRYGILVMQDMVNSGPYSYILDSILPTLGINIRNDNLKDKERFDFFIKSSSRIISQLKSHPSIIGYTIYNEGWGQQNTDEAYRILKNLDKSRLFDSASGWFKNSLSDFESFHIYFRNKVLNSNDTNKLLILSECGGFSRRINGHLFDENRSYGYGVTESEEELTDAIVHMHESMTIPSIKNGLCGVIMTQISDVEEEINGLMTYDREVLKVNKERIIEINSRIKELFEKEYL